MPGLNPAMAWPPQVPPPTLSERRGMKKAAQPEHSYTGYIPKWLDPEEPPIGAATQQRHAPILGYSGHLRHDEDRIGTTFAKGLEIARRPQAAPAGPLTSSGYDGHQQSHQTQGNHHHHHETQKKVTFQHHGTKVHKTKGVQGRAAEPVSRDESSDDDHGDCQATPMSARSGYGAFDGASGYGEFQAKPKSGGSGYGAFEGASGYGEFQARPKSTASGYGAFDGASGYGAFQAKPTSTGGSGYGGFDGASGYGQFAARPSKRGAMSARSGYGAFDNASGYGEFQAKPRSEGGSEYGAFDGASGYGAFLDRPEIEEEEEDNGKTSPGSGYGAFGGSDAYGDFMSARSGYGAFENASGYGAFQAAPSHRDKPTACQPPSPPTQVQMKEQLDRQYQRALRAVGGDPNVTKLLDAFAVTIAQRHYKRTELLQTIKRHFEKHEPQNQGKMTKAQLKKALQGLACVFTDDQIMALMAVYDPECRGCVPMDALLTDLTRRAMANS